MDKVGVITGVVPVDTLAKKAYCLCKKRRMKLPEIENTERWRRRSRLNHTLIPHIKASAQKRHDKINYHLIQFLSRPNVYRKYLYRFQMLDSLMDDFPFSLKVIEGPEHVIFHCILSKHKHSEHRRVNGEVGGKLVRCELYNQKDSGKTWENKEGGECGRVGSLKRSPPREVMVCSDSVTKEGGGGNSFCQ